MNKELDLLRKTVKGLRRGSKKTHFFKVSSGVYFFLDDLKLANDYPNISIALEDVLLQSVYKEEYLKARDKWLDSML